MMMEYKKIGWWYWLATVGLLALGLSGKTAAFQGLIAFSAIQVLHYALREKSFTAFPVQVRLAFLIYVLMAYPEPMRFLYWIPMVGVTARVFTGYCFRKASMSARDAFLMLARKNAARRSGHNG